LEIILHELAWVEEVMPVQTNIIVVKLKDATKRAHIIDKLAQSGIRILPFGEGMIRMVTHLNVSVKDIDVVRNVLKKMHV
jgi:threonine aldolase